MFGKEPLAGIAPVFWSGDRAAICKTTSATAVALCLVALLLPFIPKAAAQSDMPKAPIGAFATETISVAKTPYSDKWQRLLEERADLHLTRGCTANDGHCDKPLFKSLAAVLERAEGASWTERIALVNRAVNQAVTWQSDRDQYGVEDHWASFREVVASGRGDCVDIALVKMWLLRAAGVPAEVIHLVLAKEFRRDKGHAVLAVRLNGQNLVLDSLNEAVVEDVNVHAYKPLVSLAADGAWIHGHRRTPEHLAANQ